MEVTITRVHKMGDTITVVSAYSVDGTVTLDVTVPPATTNQLAALAVDKDLLKTLFVDASQTVTLKTNSTSTPGNTWTLNPGRPLDWAQEDGFFANPVAADIASIYLTNAGTATAKVRLRFGLDS